MNSEEISAINRERLGRWVNILAKRHATAQVLVSIGHDHNGGQLELCTTEDVFSDAQLAAILRWAAAQLDNRGSGVSGD
jgi:hypothetical protein